MMRRSKRCKINDARQEAKMSIHQCASIKELVLLDRGKPIEMRHEKEEEKEVGVLWGHSQYVPL
jgi:hypothetical protein